MKWRKTCLIYSAASWVLTLVLACPSLADDIVPGRADHAPVSAFENKGSYKISADDTQMGDIDVYISPIGSYVPLDSLVTKLGYVLYRDDASQLVQITFADKTTLTLNFARAQYMQGGKTEDLSATDYILIGPYIFLNSSFMNRVFPVGFSVDEVARKLLVRNWHAAPIAPPTSPQSNASPETSVPTSTTVSVLPMTPVPDNFPVPDAAPRQPVIVDDFSARTANPNPAPTTEGRDVVRLGESVPTPLLPPVVPQSLPQSLSPTEPLMSSVPETTPSSVPALPVPPPPEPQPTALVAVTKEQEEDGTLILQPKIKKLPLGENFIEALQKDGTLYLPLGDMMSLLEFNVKVDEAAGKAEGNFMAPPRSFALNIEKKEIQIDGHSETITKADIIKQDGHIYITATAFEKYFGIRTKVSHQSMVMALDTDASLPMEERAERHGLWQKLLAAENAKPQGDYVKVENPYQLVAWPSVDVNLSSDYQHNASGAGGSAGGTYSILSGGDLGYMTTNVLLTGSDQKKITNLRITSGRKDPYGELLGGLHATNFSIGDIESPSIDSVISDPNGRGVVVSNRPLNASSGFDTHTFVGNATPGWEVELYQNKTLLTFQTIGSDGRYTFTNIPLLYGKNDFRIVLYGPQGQTEERLETIVVGDTMVKPEQFEYTFSASQKDKNTLKFLTSTSDLPTASNDLRSVAQIRYGLTQYLTTGVSLTQTTVPVQGVSATEQSITQNDQHRYVSTNLDASLGGAFLDLNAVRDLQQGWMGGATLLTSIDDISLRLRHRQFNHFLSETENTNTGQHKSDTEISATGQFYAPLIQDYNFGVKAERETFVVQPQKTTYSTTFSKSFWGTSLSNTLAYVKQSDKQTQGTTGWQTRIGNVLVRAEGQYEVIPTFQLQDANLTTEYRIDKEISALTKLTQQITPDKSVMLSQTFNWNFPEYQLSLNSNIDDKGAYGFGASMVFSLSRDPVRDEWHMQRQSTASAGGIATRIFQDNNYNGIYDEGDLSVADARPRMNHLPIPETSDGSYLSPVEPYTPIDISIDPATLKDPMLSTGSTGYKIVTRPGDVVALDLPVISTSEVDGVITVEDDTGARGGLSDIVVELLDIDGKVIKRVISEAEGYFIFDKVKPGDYMLSVPTEALSQFNATLVEPTPVKITQTSDFYTGKNILIHTSSYAPLHKDDHKTDAKDNPKDNPKDNHNAEPEAQPLDHAH